MNKTILKLILSYALRHSDFYQLHVDFFYTSDRDFLYSDLIIWDLDHSCPCLTLRLSHPLLSALNSSFSLSQVSVIDCPSGFIHRFSISQKFNLS